MRSLWKPSCAFLLVLCLPPAAHALPEEPLPTYVANGRVLSIVRSGDTIYLGGLFTRLAPRTGAGAAFGLGTGPPDPSFPEVNGSILSVVADGDGGFLIGGAFTRVGGLRRRGVAQIDRLGAITGFNPD